MSNTIEARKLVTTLVKSVFTPNGNYSFLHPDDEETYQTALQAGTIPVRIFSPRLIADSQRLGGLLWWFCVVEIATSTVDLAEREGDKLVAVLAPDITRTGSDNFQPRTNILREQGFARCQVQFRQLTDAQPTP